MSKIIFQLSGWKRSGKDTVASILYEYGYKRAAFADTLKESVSKSYGFPVEWTNDADKKEAPIFSMPATPQDASSKVIFDLIKPELKDKNRRSILEGADESGLFYTPRALCILEGTMRRQTDSQFWVKQAINKIESMDGNAVISDLRYRSETEQLKQWARDQGYKLVLVRINRFDKSPSSDASEIDLDNYDGFDVIIENRAGVKELEDSVVQMLKKQEISK